MFPFSWPISVIFSATRNGPTFRRDFPPDMSCDTSQALAIREPRTWFLEQTERIRTTMAGTLARLFRNKLALGLLAAAIVAGTGTVIAVAAANRSTVTASSNSNNTNGHGDEGDAQQTPKPDGREVEGRISSINASAKSFVIKTRGGKSMTVTVNAKTVFDHGLHSFGDLRVGMAVAVKGNSQSNTAVIATKIERAEGSNNDNNDD